MKVSVVLATYNGEKYIREQLQSILAQVTESTEIIVTDNGSVDNTIQIIESFDDNRIKVFHNDEKKGSSANFEFGLMQAAGDIIFLSDQDDVWLQNKFDTYLKWLQKFDLVVSDCKVVDENLNTLENSFFRLNNCGKGVLKNLRKNSYLGCCMAFHKKVLKLALPFPRGIEKIAMHDIWLGFVADCFFSSFFIEEILLLYRRHQGNISSASGESSFSLQRKIYFRWLLIRNFPSLVFRYMFLKSKYQLRN